MTEQDVGPFGESLDDLKELALQGNSEEQYALGVLYRDGYRVEQDATEALYWYRRAVEEGFDLTTLDEAEAKRWEEAEAADAQWQAVEAATDGDVDKQVILGRRFANGEGVTQDYAIAARFYRLAADQGHSDAQQCLGGFYFDGHGVPQDYAEGARLYRLAAEQGCIEAQAALARCYLDGRGVPQDYAEAHLWSNLAAANATDDLRNELIKIRDQAASHLSGPEILEVQGRAREWTQAAWTASAPAPQNVENAVPNLDGHPLPLPQTASAAPAPSTAPSSVSGVYAGFWWRTLALVVDAVIAFVIIVFIGGMEIAVVLSGLEDDLVVAGLVTNWLYFTLCESSTWQATLGKRLLSLRVTDLDGRRIGFGQANGRHWSKIISSLLLGIGFLMVGFDRKKQGLHDKMAGTVVVRTPAS